MSNPDNPAAAAVLKRMIDDLLRDDWPSAQTWCDAYRVLGRKPPKSFRPQKAIGLLEIMAEPPRKFRP